MPPQVVSYKKKSTRSRKAAPKVSKNVKKYVSQHIRSAISGTLEHKYWSLDAVNVSMPAVGNVYSMCDVPAGTGDSTRVGDQIRLGSFRINFKIEKNTTDTDPSRQARVIIFQWVDTDAVATPTASSILQDYFNYPTLSMLRHDALRAKTFRVMYDKTFNLDNDDPAVGVSTVLKAPGRKLQYDNGGPSGYNKIFLMLLSDASLGYYPTFSFMSKLNYTDA